MVVPELKLTKKVTADKEGAGPPLPRIVVERALEVEPGDSTSCLRTLKLTDTLEPSVDAHLLHSHITMNAGREFERSLREP